MNRTEDLRYKRIIGALPADRIVVPPPAPQIDWQHLRMDPACGGNNGIQNVTNFFASAIVEPGPGGLAANLLLAVYPRDQSAIIQTSVVDDIVGGFFPGVYDVNIRIGFGTNTGVRQVFVQFAPKEVTAGVAIGFKGAGAPPIALYGGSATMTGTHELKGRKYFPVPWKLVFATGGTPWVDADEAFWDVNIDGVMPLDQVGAA